MRTIIIEVKSDNEHVAGWTIFPPYKDMYEVHDVAGWTIFPHHQDMYEVYENDKRGNCDFLMAFDTLLSAINYVSTKACGFLDPD